MPKQSLKHRWSLSHNYLAGITAGTWWRLLRENRFAIDAPYWHRAVFISMVSVANTVWARRERRRFEARVQATTVDERPLFILGHWRSGTTLLHELLALDTSQFAFANTYQVVNPHTFLTTEEANTRRFARFLPDRRPMDNMRLSFQSPQEDEFAPCLATLLSPYIGISFPRRESVYDRYLTFREAARSEIEAWQSALMAFARKLTLKYQRPLLFKSPAHTGRVRMLLELFPKARFVHIHRHPVEVYQSSLHYFDTAVWHTYLQRPDVQGIPERVLRRYAELYDAYFADRRLIPHSQFCEVAFADLERDPLEEMARIYETLRLDGWDRFEPALNAYVETLRGYRRNRFPELGEAMRRRLAKVWARSFEAWHYR